tara:strand:- start:380 stop:664 length:285 start_codon:yes stop_codon:yes gene_type:complete
MLKWWFTLLVIDFMVLMWCGAMPAEPPYSTIALIGSAYWFAYFLIILPLLGLIETPDPQPLTIEDDFNSHYPKKATKPNSEKADKESDTSVPAE